MWYRRLKQCLVAKGFVGSASDPSLFVLVGSITIFILVYVDDIFTTGSDQEEVKKIIDQLGLEFAVQDLGKLDYFLGIRVQNIMMVYFWSSNYI